MISFIVPIYNASLFLPACIESLLAQTEKDLQILLVDDESTDDSLVIARTYAARDKRITVLQQRHAGQSVARNLGLAHASGEFIAFVDADDTVEPDWCKQHLQAIEGVDYVQSQNPTNRIRYTVAWGRLYRREALEGLRFEQGLIYEDVLFSVDLWVSGATCRVIPYCGYHYNVHPNSTTAVPHPEAQRIVFGELRKRLHTAPFTKKWIVLYTIIRLKLYFLKQ